ncbi:MAG: phospholipid carrier-dependent glycosyltransferase [Saprospiraceae bacterium]|nr:phospholipid carrier-dependent glycosyltransferase [Saprospiraceae bacterium]
MGQKLITNRETLFTLMLVTLGFLFTYQYIFDIKIDLNGDNASYYILGKALHAGEGFVNINSIHKTPNNHFPPGYPVIISLIMIFSSSFIAIKLVNGVLLLASLVLSYFLVRKFTMNKWIAWITILFLLTNSHMLRYGTIMMSEVPFIFFTLLSLTLFLKTYEQGKEDSIKYYLLAFIFLMIAFFLRTLGIALLAAFLFMMLKDIRNKWKYMLAYGAGFFLMFLPWLARSNRLGGNSYLSQLVMVNPYRPENGKAGISDLFGRLFSNIERYITREIPDVLFPFKEFNYREEIGTMEWIPGIIIVALIIIGIWKLPKYRWLGIIYFASTFFILLLWPDVWVGIRFVLPLVPLMIMAMLQGPEWLLSQLSALLNFKKAIPLWPVVLVLYFNISEIQFLRMKSLARYESKWNNYFNLAKSFQREGATDQVVSCRKPSLFYLYSETYTTNYKYTPDADELIADLKIRKADYVILDQLGYSSTFRYLYPAIQNKPEYFEVIAKLENPDTYLLKFKSD